jgi:hypothetical protein
MKPSIQKSQIKKVEISSKNYLHTAINKSQLKSSNPKEIQNIIIETVSRSSTFHNYLSRSKIQVILLSKS